MMVHSQIQRRWEFMHGRSVLWDALGTCWWSRTLDSGNRRMWSPPRPPFYYFILKWSSPSQMRFSSLFLKTWKWSYLLCYFWKQFGQIGFFRDFWNRFKPGLVILMNGFFRWDVSWACIKPKEKIVIFVNIRNNTSVHNILVITESREWMKSAW